MLNFNPWRVLNSYCGGGEEFGKKLKEPVWSEMYNMASNIRVKAASLQIIGNGASRANGVKILISGRVQKVRGMEKLWQQCFTKGTG